MMRSTARRARRGRRVGRAIGTAAVGAFVAGCLTAAATAPPVTGGATTSTDESSTTPTIALNVRPVMRHLDHPWDVEFTPDGAMLVTERDRERIDVLLPDGTRRVLADHTPGVWHKYETGLMGMAVAPDFADTGDLYVCHGWKQGDAKDIRVTQWHIDPGYTSATLQRVVISGIAVRGGKHVGCRLRFDPHGALYVSTGDARTGPLPQDLHALNGKVLRIDPATGEGWPTNPFEDSPNANERRVYTYGHRNPQGLSWRTQPGVPHGMWSVEQGTDRDDEVNRLRPGANYGWNPMPDYNPEAPMTDHTLPGRQLDARWSSGFPTLATSGGNWITGDRWGDWQGALAVGALKNSQLLIMAFQPDGTLINVTVPPELDLTYGRLRAPQMGPKHALYLTTDNGARGDVILKITPSQLAP